MVNTIDIDKVKTIFDWVASGFTIVSFILSGLIIRIIYKKDLHKNLTNKFIIQLTASEMINNLTHISPIITNLIGTREEKYNERMRVCFSQIYSGLFSNFYTLASSFLIAFRIYDLLVNNSKIFRSISNVKRAQILSLYLSFAVSFILWVTHMEVFQNNSRKYGGHFRVISCWVNVQLDYAVLSLFAIFILIIFYFSIKSFCFVDRYSQKLMDTKDFDGIQKCDSEEQIKKIKIIQKRLILYPLSTAFCYILIIIYRILSFYTNTSEEGSVTKVIICLILYSISTVFRGYIFAFVYFGSQKVMREAFYEYITCRDLAKKDDKFSSINGTLRLSELSENEQ